MATELFLGMMSGTSVDGIDAALVEFDSANKLRTLASSFTPYPEQLRASINRLALNNSDLFDVADTPLHEQLASHYAQAALGLIEQAGIDKLSVTAIANHGQTVRHEPDADPPYSLQLGDGKRIAELTGLPVITQFRQADLAAGGQGAPLMPAFHHALFASHPDSFVLNLGGIANLTRLAEPVLGFDIGPANCLMDNWIERHQGKRFDNGGAWAMSGQIIDGILEALQKDPYLHRPFPKSTGTDYYNLEWLQNRIPDLQSFAPEDVQATLLAFTVKCVEMALEQLNAEQGSLYVCGGGASNGALMQALADRLANFKVANTEQLGVPGDWVEAVGFAWLGYCHAHNIASNLPSVTGAHQALALGQRFEP